MAYTSGIANEINPQCFDERILMNRRERLMRTMQGETVDRPAVSFYEIDGFNQNPEDSDLFNIYSHPSWRPLLEMAKSHTDCIVRVNPKILSSSPEPDPLEKMITKETWEDENGARFCRSILDVGKRKFTHLTRRDRDVNTTWVLKHWLEDEEDLRLWLSLPETEFEGAVDVEPILKLEREIGDSGIIRIDIGDPICSVAPLFSMENYTVIAFTRPDLMHEALTRVARYLHKWTEAVSAALPGRLWRICGPEYASPPYLPPTLFQLYVTPYVTPMVNAIQRHGGYARIHSHGNLHDILDFIAETGCDGLDPIEPGPQGDVTLRYVRQKYGKQMVLFGNLEASDIENLSPEKMRKKVLAALEEGTEGEGRGFVLMPSACPYGRVLADKTLRNYEVILETLDEFCAIRCASSVNEYTV
jgi:hypothetical protein